MKFQAINPNRAIEDYLETIYELSLKTSKVKVSHIAQALQITKASVSQMLNKLAKGKYILYTKYKPIQLTEIGIRIGKEIHHKHITKNLPRGWAVQYYFCLCYFGTY